MRVTAAWTLVNPFGIQRDAVGEVWHAGRVTDVLELDDGRILVASVNGGVWTVTRNGDATPLSNDWWNADTSCLAFGPDGPEHVFAGSAGYGRNGALWVTDPRAADPLSAWSEIPLPDAGRGINRIMILSTNDRRRIVIASQGGLWWALIPGTVLGWQQALWNEVTPDMGLPSGAVYDVAAGPGETIVATMPGVGMFYGAWIAGQLRMHAASVVDGLITAFDNDLIFVSPDGENVDGGGNTAITYAGTQRVSAIIPYRSGVLSAFSGGGIYFSPNGQRLGGGLYTRRVYDGGSTGLRVKAMTPYQDGVITAFDDHSIYFSPDGQNLGGGGNTTLVYGGRQAVQAITQYRGGILTAFSRGGIYFSPDGQNLGGGGATSRVLEGRTVAAMISYQSGVVTAFSDAEIFYSPDGANLGGGGNTALAYGGTQTALAMVAYRNGVLTTFSGGGIYYSPNGQNLGGGGATQRWYDGGTTGLRVVSMMAYANAGINPNEMQQTSVASCAGDANIMYAVANGGGPSDDPNFIYALLSSNDGGHTWKRLYGRVINNPDPINHPDNDDLSGAAGNQGYYNNCIAISPTNCSVVALGWRNGPFISGDYGNTWRQHGGEPALGSASYDGFHGDKHAVYFNRSGHRLYTGSDGGMAAADVQLTPPNPPTLSNYVSVYNRNLANLQFQSWPARSIYGIFSVDDRLVAGGLQDNGDVYCRWRFPTPWSQVAQSDGEVAMLVPGGDLFFNNSEPSDAAGGKRGHWNGNSIVDLGIVPVLLADGTFDSRGSGGRQGHDMVVQAVSVPGLPSSMPGNQENQIIAVAGVLNSVLGLFPDNNVSPFWHWEILGTLELDQNDFITAVGSYNGLTVLVGTDSGKMLFVAPGGPPPKNVTTPSSSRVIQFVLYGFAPVIGYALADSGRSVLRLTYDSVHQPHWIAISLGGVPPEPIFSGAADWNSSPPTLYVANDNSVYVTSDNGIQWNNFAQGLPRDPHCAGLCIQSRRLFLSTWGRSVWSTGLPDIAPTPTGPFGPPLSA